MTTLSAISTQPLVHALGWTLLHLCWQGTLVAGVLWCVLNVLHGRSSRLRYAAACLALGLMVALPVGTFAHLASAEYQARAATGGTSMVLAPTLMMQVDAGAMSAPWTERIAAALDRALPWVLLAWFVGVVLFVARLHVGLMVARRLRSMATSAVTAELQQMFDAMQRRLGVERAVRLMYSALVQVPTVIGWLRPVVLIPASCLTGLSVMQIEAILAHELAHIRRHDYLVSVLQSVIETLLFYHPAVWWVSRQVRREREYCCDEIAVAVGGDRLAYARALSALEERRATMPEFVLGANGGVLTMRIRRLLGCKDDSAVSQFAAYAVLTIFVVAAGSYVATMARAEVNALRLAAHAGSPMELEAATPLNTLIAEPAVREFQLKAPVMMAQEEAPVAPVSTPPTLSIQVMQTVPSDPSVQAVPGGPVRISGGVASGMILSKVNPVYPEIAKSAHVQGSVVLHALISKTGTVESLDVISGAEMLRASARDAVMQWKYKPYLLNGQPTEVEANITVNFSLGDIPVVGPVPPGEEASAGVKQFGGDVAAPKIIYEPWPEYTELAKQDKVEGIVLIGLVVDERGTAQHVNLLRGLGDGLDEQALDAVKKYVFKPGTENGKPVAVYINVEVKFQLAASTAQGQSAGSQVAPVPPPPPPRLLQPQDPPVSGGPVQISSGVAAGMILSKVTPVYPARAKAAHVQGAVILHAIISKEGTVEILDVISGNGMLANAALDAVARWKYKPYLLNGEPTEAETSITVNFSLGDSVAQGTGRGDDAALTQAEQESRDFLAQQPLGAIIRSIDYKGLNSVTQQEVAERFNRNAVGLKLETPFDAAQVLRASTELKQLLVEDGHPNAKVLVTTKTIPPGAIGIVFNVIEGPKGAAQGSSPVVNNNMPNFGDPNSPLVRNSMGNGIGTGMGNGIGSGSGSGSGSGVGGGVLQVGGDVKGPVIIYQSEPEFTPEGRKAKVQGIVTVGLVVNERGIPQNVHVSRGMGIGTDGKPDPKFKKAWRKAADGMNQSAVDAVTKYRFKPASENGKPVAVYLNVEVNFAIF